MRLNPDCVVKVGDGRGFIIKHRVKVRPWTGPEPHGFQLKKFVELRLVVTAAHCLPKLPPSCSASYVEERSYKLLGTLDGSKANIRAECLFVNPVADIAVLGPPDNQTFCDEEEGYDALTEDAPFLRIANARAGKGWVLSLDGQWAPTTIETDDYSWWLSIGPDGPNEPGMSGSPILNDAGRAIGVVVVGSESVGKSGQRTQEQSGLQPKLTRDLPGWLLPHKVTV